MKRLKAQSGLSLVEILIVSAIMGVVLLAFTTAYTQVQKTQKMISQKLEIADLKGMMMKVIMNSAQCDWQVQGPAATPFTLNTTQIDAVIGTPPDFLNLPGLYLGTDNTSQPLALPNQLLTGTTTQLRVQNVRITDIVSTTGNVYRGVLEVSFLPASMPISLNPARAEMLFSVNDTDPPNARRITACNGSPGGGGGAGPETMIVLQQYPRWENGGDVPAQGLWPAPDESPWYPRHLNIVRENTIVGAAHYADARTPGTQATVNSYIELPPGRYYIRAFAHADDAGDHKAKWFNLTTNSDVLMGTTAYANNGAASNSFVSGTFQVNAVSRFQLRHKVGARCTEPECWDNFPGPQANGYNSTQGGNTGWDDVVEIYAQVEIQRLE